MIQGNAHMTKPERVTITELNHIERSRLLADTVYSRFVPVKCYSCGRKDGFNRRIFRITGVQKDKHADDDTQNFFAIIFSIIPRSSIFSSEQTPKSSTRIQRVARYVNPWMLSLILFPMIR
jgi:hypothetical protein